MTDVIYPSYTSRKCPYCGKYFIPVGMEKHVRLFHRKKWRKELLSKKLFPCSGDF